VLHKYSKAKKRTLFFASDFPPLILSLFSTPVTQPLPHGSQNSPFNRSPSLFVQIFVTLQKMVPWAWQRLCPLSGQQGVLSMCQSGSSFLASSGSYVTGLDLLPPAAFKVLKCTRPFFHTSSLSSPPFYFRASAAVPLGYTSPVFTPSGPNPCSLRRFLFSPKNSYPPSPPLGVFMSFIPLP